MRIGFVTDEISPDVEEAIRIGVSWDVRDFELRIIGKQRIPYITDKQIDQILQLKNKFHLNITALSPGTFKCHLREKEQIQREICETLPRTFQLADILGVKTVIVFGFPKSDDEPTENEERVLEILSKVAKSALKQELIVAIENEPGFWCDSGKNTARILSKINSPALRANWDPANAVGTDEIPFPNGYKSIKDWIANVHIKDTAKTALIECVLVGEGKVDWQGQLQALVKDRLVEHVTIETHCLPLVEKSKINLKIVRDILHKITTIHL